MSEAKTKPKRKRGVRRSVDVDVYYKCPNCRWIGYCVTNRYYVQCGQCRRVFGYSGKGRTVTKAQYDTLYRVGES